MDVAKRIALITLFVVCAWFVVKAVAAMGINASRPDENAPPYQGYFAGVR